MILPIENQPLSALSTLGIGGPAKFYIEVKQLDEMKEALLYCKKHKIPFFILGKGSNSLFDDKGFNGCVIHNKIDFIKVSSNTFHVGAGYSFSRLGTHTAKLGFQGLEFASGIPASVGGAVYMNAGANGTETKDCLSSVDFIDEEGNFICYLKEDLSFSYRTSSFQQKKGAIVGATFSLTKNHEARTKQLEIIRYRQKTQPYGEKSLGCVFRNHQGKSAGQLIEACGLKELTHGHARVSSLHANFLINLGLATATEFKQLIQQVKKSVKQQTGIDLECEIREIPYEL